MRMVILTVATCVAAASATAATAQQGSKPATQTAAVSPATTTAARTATPAGNASLTCPSAGCVLDLRGAAQPRLEIRGSSAGTTAATIAAVAAVLAAALAGMSVIGGEAWKNYLRRRGVIGLISEDLHRWEGTIVEAYYRGVWWQPGALLAPQSGPDDLKRAVTALRPEEWGALSSARRWIDYLEAVRSRKAPASTVATVVLEPEERRWMAETFYRLEAARWALLRQSSPFGKRRGGRWQARWKGYRQEQLASRFTGSLAPSGLALTTLDGTHKDDLKALVDGGVSAHITAAGSPLLPTAVAGGDPATSS